MEVFIIEVPESETKFLKQVLKKINGRIIRKDVPVKPNKGTLEAIGELGSDKMIKFDSVKQLFDSV